MMAAIASPDRPASFASCRYSGVSMTVCMVIYTAMPYRCQQRCSSDRMRSFFEIFSFAGFRRRTPGTAAVLVDEFDAGQLQGAPDRQVVSRRHGRLAVGQLGPAVLS